MLVFAFRSEIWIVQNFNFTIFEDFCLSLSWKYRFLQNVNHAKVQSKTNKYCKFHVDLTRRRLSKSRFKTLGMVPKKLYRNTLRYARKMIRLGAIDFRLQKTMVCFVINTIRFKSIKRLLASNKPNITLTSGSVKSGSVSIPHLRNQLEISFQKALEDWQNTRDVRGFPRPCHRKYIKVIQLV